MGSEIILVHSIAGVTVHGTPTITGVTHGTARGTTPGIIHGTTLGMEVVGTHGTEAGTTLGIILGMVEVGTVLGIIHGIAGTTLGALAVVSGTIPDTTTDTKMGITMASITASTMVSTEAAAFGLLHRVGEDGEVFPEQIRVDPLHTTRTL